MEFITLKNYKNVAIIQNVIIRPLKINHDNSSRLIETLRTDWQDVYGSRRGFFMQYCSVVSSGTAKDENEWHFHNFQEDRITVVSGEIVLAVADTRKNSKTKGVINLFYMTSEINPFMIVIPRKTLHGFVVVSKEKAVLLNFPTALYNPKDNKNIPFSQANVDLPNGIPFAWDEIKKYFNLK